MLFCENLLNSRCSQFFSILKFEKIISLILKIPVPEEEKV